MGWTSDDFSDGNDRRAWYDSVDDMPADNSVRAIIEHDYVIEDMADEYGPDSDTLIVPGTGVIMGMPFLKRRERSMMFRITVLALMACILVTGIFAVSPLDASSDNSDSAFQALAGSMIWSHQPGYFFYTAMTGDTPEAVAKKFHVQVGGIYELNRLYAGQEFAVGTAYKIPLDSNYGKDFQPVDIMAVGATNYGNKRFGPNWWNSIAGQDMPAGMLCAPDGGADPMGFHLTSPNWNSYWVRGYIVYGTWVYHTGVDLAAPRGNPIHAAQQGQVIWAGYDATNGLGYSVKIDHCNHVSTVYGHMDSLLVRVGQFVSQGQVVGLEGSTGASFGPHLHYMVEWNNMWVDPMPFYASKYTITNYVSA